MKKVTALILALLLMIFGTAAFAATFTHPETGENVTVDGTKAFVYDGRVYEEVPANVELNGVKPDGKVDLVTAMTTVAASMTEQLASGKIDAVEILGIPEAVKDSFNALTIEQQMLVLLVALGGDVDIPEDELALLQTLIDALDPEIIAASFPKVTIVVDGVSYEYFVIELKVTVGDTVEYERYGFRLTTDGEWVLERITISEV